MNMDRGRLVIKNTLWDIVYYATIIILGFLAPKYIVQFYGSEVNGLSASINQILNVIMLLQAGAVTAALYSIYKPVSNNNIPEICYRYTSSVKYFRKISYTFLAIMCMGAILSTMYIKSSLNVTNIFIAFIILGFKSFLDILFTSKYRVIFTAYQQKFYLSVALMLEHIFYYGFVFITIGFRWNFLFLFVSMLAGCVVKIVYLYFIKQRKYPEIKELKGKDIPANVSGKNYALANEVAHSLATSSIAIIISFLYGLEETSIYSIYMLVFSAIHLILISFSSSFGPSFANLYATGDIKGASKVFNIFCWTFDVFSTVMLISAYCLISPFVNLYIGNESDICYYAPKLALYCTLISIFYAYRLPYNILVSSCGFFKETWLQPCLSFIVSLAISIIAGKYDYTYITFGPLFFYFTNYLYQVLKLKSLMPQIVSFKTFMRLAVTLICLIISIYFTQWYIIDYSFIHWIGISLIVTICCFVFVVATNYIVDKQSLNAVYAYIQNKIKKRK